MSNFDVKLYRDVAGGVVTEENSPGNFVAADWSDKPHRLVYDLCTEVERLTAELVEKELQITSYKTEIDRRIEVERILEDAVEEARVWGIEQRAERNRRWWSEYENAQVEVIENDPAPWEPS